MTERLVAHLLAIGDCTMTHLASRVEEEHQTPEHLAEVHEQLWQYVQQFGNLSAQQERNRIARDLHDSLGHALTALNIQLQTAVKLWQLNPAQAQQFLAKAQQLGAVAIKEVRQSVSTLRTDTPETQSLSSLIESLVADFEQTTGLLPSTHINIPVALPPEVVTPLYRILQEALNNICKYAQATEVQIQAIATASAAHFTIQDNGRGFQPEAANTGFGLQGMRERVAILGGKFRLESAPGAGCRIVVEVPLPSSYYQEQEQLYQLDDAETIPTEGTETTSSFSLLPEPDNQAEVLLPELFAQPQPCFTLSPEQRHCLEPLLTELVGPVALELIPQLAPEVSSVTALIEELALHVPPGERQEFRQQATLLLTTVTARPLAPEDSLLEPQQQVSSESFICRCEQELTELIGPIASFLIQEIMLNSPQISPETLVKSLSNEISDPQIAAEFKRRLLA